MIRSWDEQLAEILADPEYAVDTRPADKRCKEMLKLVQATAQRSSERQALEKQQQQRRQRERHTLQQQGAADLSAEELNPEAQQEKLKEIQRQVEDSFAEVDELGDEPDTYMTVVKAPQALPQLKLVHLSILQETLTTCRLVTGSSEDINSSSALEAAFTWLLRGSWDQLLVCPDADVAKATFQAVCFGGRELATAAYNRFLGWCGMSELQRGCLGKDVTEQLWVSQLDSRKPGLSGILCRSDQQQQPTAAWVPTADDFIKALTALGCNTTSSATATAGGGAGAERSTASKSNKRSSAATAAAAAAAPVTPTPAQQQGTAAPISNIKLLLQLLMHLCRLQSAETARLPYSLGSGVQGAAACKQLAHMLVGLMLDRQLAEANCGCLLTNALDALIAAIGESEWGRVEKQLLDALSQGIGPSNRSLLHVLSQLPLSPRGASLKQQAALQLVSRVTTAGRRAPSTAQAKHISSGRDVHRELVKLLGQDPSKGRLSHLTVTDKDGKQQQDTWALLDLVEAAHMVLWTDMIRTDSSVDDDIIKWFIKWSETLEGTLHQKVASHRVRNTLTELANAYRFWGSSNTSAMDLAGADDEDHMV